MGAIARESVQRRMSARNWKAVGYVETHAQWRVSVTRKEWIPDGAMFSRTLWYGKVEGE